MPYADKVYTDALGNVIAEKKCGRENALKIMIEGHMDEIGLMVSGIDENGFVRIYYVVSSVCEMGMLRVELEAIDE